jgi:SAM dependent carboxyl methyltransferase
MLPQQESSMSDESRLPHGVMEGKGSYNKHAKLPAGGAALAMPLLEKAVRSVRLDPADQPVVIADYGSSQGKNSLAPMSVAIKTLRSRLGPDRPIVAYHVDQPSNDFNSLFEVLDADPDRYAVDEPNVFPCAIGRSFYRQVLPADYVHLGWSSYAAVWLSRIPGPIPGHFFAAHSPGGPPAEFVLQAAKDWETFLYLRALELRPGGRLVVVLPALDERGASGFEALVDHVNQVLAELVDQGLIQTEERARMVLGSYPRRESDLLAPFARNGHFRQLVVEDCQFAVLEDSAWGDYQRDGDKEALAARHALFFRAIFVPSLASALDRAGDAEACRVFGDQLVTRLKQRLASQPAAMHSFVSTIVLAKQGSA